jgi:hypothetical protein
MAKWERVGRTMARSECARSALRIAIRAVAHAENAVEKNMPEKGEMAFGGPGISPRWTSSAKEGVGTAYSTGSRIWFTLSHGILNEIYYPAIDRSHVRDMQFLITDGETFFHEEKRDLENSISYVDEHTPLSYRKYRPRPPVSVGKGNHSGPASAVRTDTYAA